MSWLAMLVQDLRETEANITLAAHYPTTMIVAVKKIIREEFASTGVNA